MSVTHKRVTDSISHEAMAERFYNAALAAHTEARRHLVVCADRLAALAAEPWTKPADLARAAEAVAAAHEDVADRNDLLAHAAQELHAAQRDCDAACAASQAERARMN